jgi:hypothetical protein
MAQIENVPGLPAGYVIITDVPSHIADPNRMFIIKKASYRKGQYPSQLKEYAGQIKTCPTGCAGKKGQDYRDCLLTCAANKKAPAEEKAKRRKAYATSYREMIKKKIPRVMVAPVITAP